MLFVIFPLQIAHVVLSHIEESLPLASWSNFTGEVSIRILGGIERIAEGAESHADVPGGISCDYFNHPRIT